MGLARSQTVLPGEPSFYHCIGRCVRRAWLCGVDPLTGLDFNHRRGWIEGKALELAEIFAVSVYAYAVMSNHMHLVVSIEPTRVESWTDEEIAERWSRVTTRLSVKDSASEQRQPTSIQGLKKLSLMISKIKRFAKRSWFNFRNPIYEDDMFLVSYPKSGNTWLRFVLSNLIADGSEQVDFNTSLKYTTSFEDVRRARKLPKPRILKSHSQYDERFCNVVYILRDPREVYISFYHYLKGHLPNQTTLSQFIRSDFMFPGKWHEHTSSWANKHNVRITVRYEEMLSDPIQVVNNIVESVPTLNYSRQQIEKAVELSNFGRMKDLEDKFGRPFSSEEERKKATPFMRSGASDTWRQVLSERDLQYIESISREEMIRLNYEVTS